MAKKTVVVVGGGFGGVRAALDLSRHEHDLKIIVVDKDGYHSYPADYYKLLSPSHDGKEHFGPAKFRLMFSSVSIPLAEIFEGKKNVEIVFGEASGLDSVKNELILSSGSRVKYDWLILAVGSATNFYGIPGLASRAIEFKSTEDSLNLRNAVDEAFARKGKRENIDIVVGGGGFTGSEVASELIGYAKNLAELLGQPAENLSVSIVEASSVLLGSAGEWVSRKAALRLKNLGVQIFLGDPLVDVKDNAVDLKSGKSLDFDILVWTAGVKANLLAEKISGLNLSKGSCITVDEYLRVNLAENIFAIGDVAFCMDKDKPMPMTSQTAISQGRYIAYYIKRKLRGREAFKYHPKKSNFIIPLGGRYALLDLGRFRTEGFMPWVLKRFVALKYFLSILSIKKAFRAWLLGIKF